ILVASALEAARTMIGLELGCREPQKCARQKQTVLWGLEIGVGSGAVVVARDNARRHGAAHRLRFVRSDLLSGVNPGPRFALLVANLPYVPRAQWEQLPREIRDFEPQQAL